MVTLRPKPIGPPPLAPDDLTWTTVGLLEDLTQSDRKCLLLRGKMVCFDEGEVLLKQGESQDSLFVILEGSVKVRCTSPYSIVDLAVLTPGDSFGEMGLLDPLKASASVTGTTPGVMWTISRRQLRTFTGDHTHAGMALYRALGVLLTRRLRRSDDRLIRCSERPIGFDYDY